MKTKIEENKFFTGLFNGAWMSIIIWTLIYLAYLGVKYIWGAIGAGG